MQYPDNEPSDWSRYWPSEASFKPGIKMIRGFLRPFGTKEVSAKFIKLLDDFHPDVVHVGNIHSQLSPIIVKIAHDRGIKVVWTIHDYKLLCPRYDFLKDGKEICTECISNPYSVVINKCVKKSRIASYLGYKEIVKWNPNVLNRYTDAFICASEFVSSILKKGGYTQEKIFTIPHSIDTASCSLSSYPTSEERSYYCYIGRLSHEKGVKTLIDATNKLPYKLIVIGDGPLLKDLKSIAHENIEFVGFQDWTGIKKIVSRARFCVAPSEWFEVLGLVNLEALCLGTPVLGANIGSIPYLIEENKNGMLFTAGSTSNLVEKIQEMFQYDFNYEAIARKTKLKFSPENYYDKIIDIYTK